MKEQIEILFGALVIILGLWLSAQIGQLVYRGAQEVLAPVLGF
uniref:Uncharacterized protein n=1 Tax=viral metagenome TaxID=1070528 RepID=A0A6M3X5E7_9ZZZZ